MEKITMWPEVNGTVTPLYLAKKSQLYLPGFMWYSDMRPKNPDDIYAIPKEMKDLLDKPTDSQKRTWKRK